ncbi:hypothetical protein EOPP23_00275 [Endozoicomonas sp. OPT23]|uniref:OmpA family protein n=1 Tax=Endozoicomonas sp. OPT23 TaxID=2072845 RepID=UPI00129A0E42|nr:OmpA family protein [Endozoicomonas sp. OPT23]MRI31424.1 hypothetical protein [Endozoicomonas sp. OPT23]
MSSNLFKGLSALILFSFLTGCASHSQHFKRDAICTVVGAGVGGVANGNDSDDRVKGAIGGALVGALLCHVMDGDADGDGVKDSQDQCPATPMGKAVDEVGCALDKDEDGVVNAQDMCPATPKGDVVDQKGCTVKKQVAQVKVLDDDRDGVLNNIDQCADTPLGAAVDAKGCPVVVKVNLQGVGFKFNSADLTEGAKTVLAKQAKALKENPLLRVSVTGHTDSDGDAAYNKSLSFDRATSVAKFLEEQGIDQSIFKVVGAGEEQPIADNTTLAGKAKNRRVELGIISE